MQYIHNIPLLNIVGVPYILFVVGVCFLILELSTPGFALFGILGIALLILFFMSEVNMFSYSYLFAIIGIVFIIIELFTGFTGFLFTLGVIALVMGLVYAMVTSFIISSWLLLIVLIGALILVCFGFYLGIRKIISLKKQKSSFFNLVGEKGHIIGNENGFFQCRLDGSIWSVKSDDTLSINDRIRVIKADLNHSYLIVKKEP